MVCAITVQTSNKNSVFVKYDDRLDFSHHYCTNYTNIAIQEYQIETIDDETLFNRQTLSSFATKSQKDKMIFFIH